MKLQSPQPEPVHIQRDVNVRLQGRYRDEHASHVLCVSEWWQLFVGLAHVKGGAGLWLAWGFALERSRAKL